jgi:Flp pilus assembly protein TadG
MHRLGHRRRDRGQRGAVAIEFALILPILLIVLGGIVNFGMAFSQKLALDNAVRQAVRSAVVDSGSALDPAAEAQTVFAGTVAMAQGETAAITFVGASTCEGSTFGAKLHAQGKFKSNFMFPWLVPGMPKSITWTSDGEFQCEYS